MITALTLSTDRFLWSPISTEAAAVPASRLLYPNVFLYHSSYSGVVFTGASTAKSHAFKQADGRKIN